ncbi:MAG: LCP family protein [Firmicutes bacterium]|nr:LCP family protein [Bacillota bacterium]
MKSSDGGVSAFVIVVIVLCVFLFVLVAAAGGFLVFYEPDTSGNMITAYKYVTDEEGNVMYETDEEGNMVYAVNSSADQTSGKYNFLVVGHDKISRNTDIIMIVSYDTYEGSISIVQIPRDTYVNVDFMSSHKINAAYTKYYSLARSAGSENPDYDALMSLSALITENFGVKINYAAVFDIEGFANVIDILGGVWIDVPYDLNYEDPGQNLYIHLSAGYQLLDGDQAMQFVRYRKGYAEQDLGRQDAMKIFISALLSQLKANMSVSAVSEIASELLDNMISNIGLADFIYFAKSALSVDLSKVYLMTLPGVSMTVNGASVYVLYKADVAEIISNYLNVYVDDFDTDDFDPYGIFTSDSSSVSEVYNSPLGTGEYIVYNAADVNENSIDIPTGSLY